MKVLLDEILSGMCTSCDAVPPRHACVLRRSGGLQYSAQSDYNGGFVKRFAILTI